MEMKTAVVPYSCFEDIRQDFKVFSGRGDLNRFQKHIVDNLFVLNPEPDFKPQSVIICAVPPAIKNAVFTYRGKQYSSVFEVTADYEKVKEQLAQVYAYRYFSDFWLPAKRTAVRSGLCEYGRNNLCYAGEFGSMITLYVFISDMPSPNEYVWREIKNMDMCQDCDLCQKSCPTGAILYDRFLIDNEKCLSLYSDTGNKPFPDFIPKTAHHRIFECSICQECCPANNFKYGTISENIEFSEDETNTLLKGVEYDTLPSELIEKIKCLDMKSYFSSVPRNLRALIDAVSR